MPTSADEYQTIAATGIAYCAIDYVEDLLAAGPTGVSVEDETTFLAVSMVLFFGAVRWLRKRTQLLRVAGR